MARREYFETRLVIDHLENRCLPSVDFGLMEPDDGDSLWEEGVTAAPPETYDDTGAMPAYGMAEASNQPTLMADPSEPVFSAAIEPWDPSGEPAQPLDGSSRDDGSHLRFLLSFLRHQAAFDGRNPLSKHDFLQAALASFSSPTSRWPDSDSSATAAEPAASSLSEPALSTTVTISKEPTASSPTALRPPNTVSLTETRPATTLATATEVSTVETQPTSSSPGTASTGASTNSSATTSDRTRTAVPTEDSPSISRDTAPAEANTSPGDKGSTNTSSVDRSGQTIGTPPASVERTAVAPAETPALRTTVNLPASETGTSDPPVAGTGVSAPSTAAGWSRFGMLPFVSHLREAGDRAAGAGIGVFATFVKHVAGAFSIHRESGVSAVEEPAAIEHADAGAQPLPELLAGVSDLAPDVLLGDGLLADPQWHALPPDSASSASFGPAEGIVKELAASAGVIAVSAAADRWRRRKPNAGLFARCTDWLRRTLRLDRPAGRSPTENDTQLHASAADVSRNWIRLDDTELGESSRPDATPGTTPWTIVR